MSGTQFSEMELLLYKLYVMKAQGQLDAVITADKTGTIQKALDTYTLSPDRFNEINFHLNKRRNRNHQTAIDLTKSFDGRMLPSEINAAASELVKTLRPVRHLSYFERQTARALGKSLDSFGNIDLQENSNRVSGQSNNRNFKVAAASTEQMFGKTEFSDDLQKAELVKMRSYCAQYCRQQGNTRCRYCLGKGFAAMNNPSRSYKAREIQAKNRSASTSKV